MINKEAIITFKGFEGTPDITVQRDKESVILHVGQEFAVLNIEEADAVFRAFSGAIARAEEERKRNKSWIYRKLFS